MLSSSYYRCSICARLPTIAQLWLYWVNLHLRFGYLRFCICICICISYLYLYFSDIYCVHHHHTCTWVDSPISFRYLFQSWKFIFVWFLKIGWTIKSDQNANYFSNLIKYKQVGSSLSKIYSLAPARVQLNYCYTRECQGTKQFRRVISYSRVLMQGLFIPV